MTKLKVLDLFSGIGGFSLGLERTGGFSTVAFCEIEPFPRKVLAKHWPDVPCFEDVRKLKGEDVGPVDVICGGYPCQPFSTAGKRGGAEDDRHLWPEFNRLVAELRPTWVIGENVAGHISMGLDDVLSDLEGQGYACRTFVIPACAVDAKHRRDRVWTVAYAESERRGKARGPGPRPPIGPAGASSTPIDVADPTNTRLPVRGCSGREEVGEEDRTRVEPGTERLRETLANTKRLGQPGQGACGDAGHSKATGEGQATKPFDGCLGSVWPTEPAVGRVAHGVPGRVDRLKALGNAVVPQIPEMIGQAILEATK